MGIRGKDRQIDNIEFNVSDIARSKAFYAIVFGWSFVDYGPTYTEFSDGRLTGGFTTGEPVRPGGPLIILYADDLEGTRLRIEAAGAAISRDVRSEEHTSELQSLMRISYAVFCLKKKKNRAITTQHKQNT